VPSCNLFPSFNAPCVFELPPPFFGQASPPPVKPPRTYHLCFFDSRVWFFSILFFRNGAGRPPFPGCGQHPIIFSAFKTVPSNLVQPSVQIFSFMRAPEDSSATFAGSIWVLKRKDRVSPRSPFFCKVFTVMGAYRGFSSLLRCDFPRDVTCDLRFSSFLHPLLSGTGFFLKSIPPSKRPR